MKNPIEKNPVPEWHRVLSFRELPAEALRTLGAGLSFVDGQSPATPLGAVEGVDNGLSGVGGDLHKTEATATAGLTVGGDTGADNLGVLLDGVEDPVLR